MSHPNPTMDYTEDTNGAIPDLKDTNWEEAEQDLRNDDCPKCKKWECSCYEDQLEQNI